MNVLRNAVAIASISLLSACVSWPNEGEGGFAEYQTNDLISVEYNQPLREKHGLRFDHTLAKNKLSLLKLQGAYYCFPASVEDATLLEHRISRELSGGLYGSATANIVKQRIALRELEHKLVVVLNKHKCKPPTEKAHQSNRHTLLALLNADNQFAVDSIELNQKYKNNLEIAAKLLKQSSIGKILIIGSTDEKGSEQYNLILSRKRAQAVRQYLIADGVKPDNIDIIASGKASPVYAGNSDASRLINRNVRIYLIEG